MSEHHPSDPAPEVECATSSDTMHRCEVLIRKHAPKFMKLGGYMKDGVTPERKGFIKDSTRICVLAMHRNKLTHQQIKDQMHVSLEDIRTILHQDLDSKWKPEFEPDFTPIKADERLYRMEACPACGCNWLGDEILEYHRHLYGGASHYHRLIGIETPGYDGVSIWQCPDCKAQWDRWTNKRILPA